MVEDEQQRELREEGKRIATLQESLQTTHGLCSDMIKQLEQFETRVASFEPLIMPLHRNLATISRVYGNIEATLGLVRMLADKNDLVRREEFTLSNGPSMDNLDTYLASIQRVQQASTELRQSNLDFCEITIRRLESTNRVALDSLGNKYKEWLLEASQLDSASATGQALTGGRTGSQEGGAGNTSPNLSTDLTSSLLRIANFAAGADSEEPTTLPASTAGGLSVSDVLGYYVEVRSRHMINQLQRLFQVATDSSTPSSKTSAAPTPSASAGPGIAPSTRSSYQRGCHPLIVAIKEFYRLAERETLFAPLALPSSVQTEAIRRTTKHPADMVRLASEAAASNVIKAAGRGEFLEQLWIFDVIDVFTSLWNRASAMTQELTKIALKAITEAGVHLLRALMDLMQDFSGGAHMGVASANATVFEETSSLMNCLKRMLEYEPIIETLLTRWSQKDWDGIIRKTDDQKDAGEIGKDEATAAKVAPSFAMALYYQDLLRGLEVSIEQHSHVYKKPLTGVLFQLNNYHYMVRAFRATPGLASLLTLEAAQKYESIVEALLRDYLAHWLHTASLLTEGSTRGAGTLSPRDRLKTFASEWEDLVKSQAQCAVPDGELRRTLQARVQEAVLPSFTTFYNLHQSVFHSLASRIKLDPPTIETQIGQLYQA